MTLNFQLETSPCVLGIDPGFGRMGYGVIAKDARGAWRALAYGCVETSKSDPLPERLLVLHRELNALITKYHPTHCAVEKLFFFKNVTTAIDVGQARGVVLLAVAEHKLVLDEFTPLQVKQSMTGFGRADKGQVQKMVTMLLGLKDKIKSDDAADALAVALCAGQLVNFKKRIAGKK